VHCCCWLPCAKTSYHEKASDKLSQAVQTSRQHEGLLA
jgi:hypothetical protein